MLVARPTQTHALVTGHIDPKETIARTVTVGGTYGSGPTVSAVNAPVGAAWGFGSGSSVLTVSQETTLNEQADHCDF
jgi:hypothetical protein